MSPRAKRKQGFTLQVSFVAGLLLLTGCAGLATGPVHPTSSDKAVTLKHVQTIDKVGLGPDSKAKAFFFGDDIVDLQRPVAIGMHNDMMLIADADRGMIYRYDLKQGRMRPIRNAGDEVIGEVSDIDVRPDESFLVTDTSGRRALHFTSRGKLKQVFESGPNLSRPISVVYDERKNEVLVADEVFSHIVAFSPDGEPKYGIGGRGSGEGKFRIITDMLNTPDGLYVSDRIEYAVQKLDNEGRFAEKFGEQELVFPTAIARDKHGRMFVADKADSKIKVFFEGKMIDVVGRNGYVNGEFRYVSDMKIHRSRLYVADSLNGRIQVFDILPPTVLNAN